MRSWIFLLAAAAAFTMGLVAGCDDDDGPPVPGRFTVALNDLPALSDTLFYEAFVRFPIDTVPAPRAGVLHEDLELVSIGAFTVDASGNLLALDGGPALFGLAEPRDLNFVADILVNVRAEDDTSLGVPLLGGQVTGSADEGHATLTTTYHDALGADLTTAAGSVLLATPTTAVGTDENQGVWFVTLTLDDPPLAEPSLTVPPVGDGWVYAAWINHGGEPIAVGEFEQAAGPDSDGAGPESGPGTGFDAPGSDFVLPPPGRDLADGETTVFVTVEPEVGGGGPAPLPGEDEPFPLRVLELAIPLGAPPRTSMDLVRPAGDLPTGSITFTR